MSVKGKRRLKVSGSVKGVDIYAPRLQSKSVSRTQKSSSPNDLSDVLFCIRLVVSRSFSKDKQKKSTSRVKFSNVENGVWSKRMQRTRRASSLDDGGEAGCE